MWNGVIINSAYGTPVRAISYGRVAFADWLQGFGFITIIDHDDGYMSLYGHNQALYKQSGDWVEAGEVIATVGDSGGQANSGLYFELRHQGKPINPNRWCSTKVQHVALQDN
jgi:septal ring factor EnvC (AmiA/AmiB activator)